MKVFSTRDWLIWIVLFSKCQLVFAQSQGGGLEEVIVTAQKRVESVQSVPVSLAVFDATVLDKSGIVALEGVAIRTPGFTMNRMNIGEPMFLLRRSKRKGDGW